MCVATAQVGFSRPLRTPVDSQRWTRAPAGGSAAPGPETLMRPLVVPAHLLPAGAQGSPVHRLPVPQGRPKATEEELVEKLSRHPHLQLCR